jgi:hypothetical protein
VKMYVCGTIVLIIYIPCISVDYQLPPEQFL